MASAADTEADLRNLDFSSWQSVLATLAGLMLVTLIGVGLRLLVMTGVQQRRERMNRQINERLRTLIAAYKALGGSFTGNLAVDPTHLRDLRERAPVDALALAADAASASDRPRRIRDAVEAALSDIILLGTSEQVRLAVAAAHELVGGRPVHTHALVIALRDFIRDALDLEPVPPDVTVPAQGPARPSGSAARGKSDRAADGVRGGGAGSGMGGGGGASVGSDVSGSLEDRPASNHG